MEDITDQAYESAQKKAVELMQKSKKVYCPAFKDEVRISPEGFRHIEWKNKNHKRNPREAYVRYICFLHVPFILKNSTIYQEFRETMELCDVKRKGKIIKERKIVTYYGFVGIVNANKNRVKIVVRKVDGWDYYEFVSIIPAWSYNGYGNVTHFNDTDQDLEKSTKKVIEDELGGPF